VDVWISGDKYTYDYKDQNHKDKTFPMLMMQLAHILMLNKVWDKKANLRVFLLVNEHWQTSDRDKFDIIMKDLRIKVEKVEEVKLKSFPNLNWNALLEEIQSCEHPEIEIKETKTAKEMKSYYQLLNEIMVEKSKKTHLTLLAMPKMPPLPKNKIAEGLAVVYLEWLSCLVKNLPPTAMVATGEPIPVISVDI